MKFRIAPTAGGIPAAGPVTLQSQRSSTVSPAGSAALDPAMYTENSRESSPGIYGYFFRVTAGRRYFSGVDAGMFGRGPSRILLVAVGADADPVPRNRKHDDNPGYEYRCHPFGFPDGSAGFCRR